MSHRFTRRRVSVEIGVLFNVGLIAALLLACLALHYWQGAVFRWFDATFGSLTSDPVQLARLRGRVLGLLGSSRISVISTAIAVTAMIMSTRRFAWWRWGLIIALPALFYFGRGYLNRWLTSGLQQAGLTDGWYIGMYVSLCINLLVAAIVAWIVRSPIVLLAGIAASILSAGCSLWVILNQPIIPSTNGGREAPVWQFLTSPAAQAVVALGLVAWAWRQRALNPVIGMCTTCGYDLRGTTHARCPECGAGVGALPATVARFR